MISEKNVESFHTKNKMDFYSLSDVTTTSHQNLEHHLCSLESISLKSQTFEKLFKSWLWECQLGYNRKSK